MAEELDERLAMEQGARAEQTALITQLQSVLTERTSKESGSVIRRCTSHRAAPLIALPPSSRCSPTTFQASRAVEAEKALAALKQEVRALRVAVRSTNMKKTVASTQTERDVAGPAIAIQTEWQAVHMPLPALPHGGTWVEGGKKPEIIRFAGTRPGGSSPMRSPGR